MAVLRLTSKKTLPLLLEALRRLQFTQTALAEATSMSVGRVNKVITWLKEKDIIVKEAGKYVINQPNRMADLIAAQQIIEKRRTYHVQATKEDLIKACQKKNITLCLHTALQHHDKSQAAQELHCVDSEAAQEYLDQLPRGEQQVILYSYEGPVEAHDYTDPVRTIIDLKSINNGQRAEALAQQIWRTRQ